MGLCLGSLAHRQHETSYKRPHYSGLASPPECRNINESADESSASSNGLKVFSLGELKAATKNFKSNILLGVGRYGKVYKGWLDERTLLPATAHADSSMTVAIKKLGSYRLQILQDQWQSVVNFLGSLSHPNLVKLFGYCYEDGELFLVYEFMPRGSLENHLFRRSPNIGTLSWNTRLKIAIDAAQGLAFLHDSEEQITYKEFKTANILLDRIYNAKISDFGLAKLSYTEEGHTNFKFYGGYSAPEYCAIGRWHVKCDVYGFGVVLLEMLTGKRALDPKRPHEQKNTVEWSKPYLSNKGKLITIMDARMKGQYSLKAAFQAAQLILRCLGDKPSRRPSMKDVVEALQGIQANQNRSEGSSSS